MSDSTPSEPMALTPEALDSLLSDLDHAAFVAFVADLRERAGWATEREGSAGKEGDDHEDHDGKASVLVATRPDGERERLLVWTDDRSRLDRLRDDDPDVPEVDTIDAVVTRTRDAEAATTVVEALDARLVDADDLHDRLLYAIDRGTCRALCEAHFDRTVEPRPAPEPDPDDADRAGRFQPRALLVGVALLGLVVAGAAGLPGGPGTAPVADLASDPAGTADVNPVGAPTDAPDTPGPAPATPTPTEAPWLDPPTDTATPPDTPTSTPGTPTPDPPETCSECASLLLLDDTELTVEPGTTTTVNSAIENPYLFGLTNVSVELRGPANWTITPLNGTSVDRLSSGETRPVAWNLTVPLDAAGEYELRTVSTYASGSDAARVVETYTATVEASGPRPPAVPPCTQALGPLITGGTCHLLTFVEEEPVEITAGRTTTVTGTLYNPREYNLTDGRVRLRPPTENWTVTPVNGTTFDRLAPGEVRLASWNLTPPVDASGGYTLVGNATYTATGADGRANRTGTHSYRVSVAPPSPPETRPCYNAVSPLIEAGTCYLLTVEGTPTVAPGGTTTVTGTLYNPREFALANGSVELRAPGNWTVTPAAGTTFDRLAPGEVRVARWTLAAPATANGTVDLAGVTNYTRLGGPDFPNVTTRNTYPVEVVDANATGPGARERPSGGPASPSTRQDPPGITAPKASRGTR